MIKSSTILYQSTQSDGTINVREQFIDDQANVYISDYQAPNINYDMNTRLANDATNLQNFLASVIPPTAGQLAAILLIYNLQNASVGVLANAINANYITQLNNNLK